MDRTIPAHTDLLSKAALFVAIVRHGSFSAAAAAMQLGRSTVSDHINTLEQKLGVRLIERTTRKLRLSEEGELLYERMSAALAAWSEACDAFEQRQSEPTGRLRVTCPIGLSQTLLAPVLSTLLRAHPKLSVDLVVDDRVRDLVGDNIDVAVRMGTPHETDAVARLLGEDPLIVVAAPELAATLDDTLESLARCAWVAHGELVTARTTLYHLDDDRQHPLAPRYRASATNSEAQLSLVAGGAGVALMPSLFVREHLARGALVRVMPRWRGRTVPIYAVYPGRRYPARTRALLDQLASATRALLDEARA
ncbi:MAG: LysR family transcriptional regulator [Myxococcales bacterium]|nr:LysR family transcriptional regulator [Myxococcales bacterium]